MFNYNKPLSFDEKPTKEEINLVKEELNKLNDRYGSIPTITEEIKKIYPKIEENIISRVVYISLHIIDDENMIEKGWRKVNRQELEELAKQGKKIKYYSQGILGNQTIILTPKKFNNEYYWILPKCKTRYMSDNNILSSWIK